MYILSCLQRISLCHYQKLAAVLTRMPRCIYMMVLKPLTVQNISD